MNNENRRPTQCDRVLRHLVKYGTITGDEADKLYGIKRLPSRISELKLDVGINFVVTFIKGKNRYEEPCHWAEYSLAEKQEVDIAELISKKAI